MSEKQLLLLLLLVPQSPPTTTTSPVSVARNQICSESTVVFIIVCIKVVRFNGLIVVKSV